MRAQARAERGAALLLAIVSIAVLTAMAATTAYESRVSLRIAANARDELRASYLARSGVTFSRLVLSFQQTVDDSMSVGTGASASATGTGTSAAATASAGSTVAGGSLPSAGLGLSIPRIQLWRLLPVSTDLARALFPEHAAAAAPGKASETGAPAVAPGKASETGFQATIDDEDRKVNAQLDAMAQTSSAPALRAQLQAIYQLICDPRWDPLFEREDEHGVRTSREDLLVRMRDWVDYRDTSSKLAATFGSASCTMTLATVPFDEGYGDKNEPYQRGDDPYRTKNARMDSLDELFLVAGVGDDFMAAFGDALTVYLKRDAKRNINELDRRRLVELATLVANPPDQPVLLDPSFGERLQTLVMQQTFGGMLALTPDMLGKDIQASGVTVDSSLLQASGPFTDRSTTFRVRSSGKAGDVSAVIDAVVRMEQAQTGEAVGAPGRLIHWRED